VFVGLEKLYNDFKDRGFCVVGFPCNQFNNQVKTVFCKGRKFLQQKSESIYNKNLKVSTAG